MNGARGNGAPLSRVQQELAGGAVRLAFWAAQQFWRRCGGDLEEWRGEACVALVRAAAAFLPDHESEAMFSTFASVCIKRHLQRLDRQQARRRDAVRIVGPETLHRLADERRRPNPNRDAVALARAALAGLPARQREALALCYLDGLTTTAAGKRLGIAKQRISERCVAGVRRARQILDHPNRRAA
jgi:RNA polymerase sigma factor (sigma-70 family)